MKLKLWKGRRKARQEYYGENMSLLQILSRVLVQSVFREIINHPISVAKVHLDTMFVVPFFAF